MRAQREYELGVGLWEEHNVAGAFEHSLASIEIDPDNSEAHLFLGNLFMITRHDHERAEYHFRQALRAHEVVVARSGLGSDARNSLGVLYIHDRRYEEAVTELRTSASDLMNRTPALSWTNLGWAYTEQGNPEEALRVLHQAVGLSPGLCMAWYRIAVVHVAGGHHQEAVEALDHALDVEDATCQRLQVAWRLRGEVRAELDDPDSAIADLERCVELSTDTEDGQACQRILEAP